MPLLQRSTAANADLSALSILNHRAFDSSALNASG